MPGLKVGDFLLVDKNAYGYKINRTGKSMVPNSNPNYGDVVVFVPKHNPVPYVKRLIAMPGDKIRVINKQVYVNGNPIKKTFHKTQEELITKRYRDLSGRITVKELDVTVDYYYEEHGNRKYIVRNIRGENVVSIEELFTTKLLLLVSLVSSAIHDANTTAMPMIEIIKIGSDIKLFSWFKII